MEQFRRRLALWALTENDKECLYRINVKWISWSASRNPLFVLVAFLQEGQRLLGVQKGTCFELRIPCSNCSPIEYDESKLVVSLTDCEFVSAITREPTSYEDSVPTLEAKFTCQEATIHE